MDYMSSFSSWLLCVCPVQRGHRGSWSPLVNLRLVVRSLCPLRYRGRSVLGPNHSPTPGVDGVSVSASWWWKKIKDRGVEVHPTQVGAPLGVSQGIWFTADLSALPTVVSHYLEKLHRLFFPASFPAVVLVPTTCEVALGTGVVTAVAEIEGEDECECSNPCPVSALEKAFGGLGATVHPETSRSGDRRPSHTSCCCCQALCPGGWMSQMFFKGGRTSWRTENPFTFLPVPPIIFFSYESTSHVRRWGGLCFLSRQCKTWAGPRLPLNRTHDTAWHSDGGFLFISSCLSSTWTKQVLDLRYLCCDLRHQAGVFSASF